MLPGAQRSARMPGFAAEASEDSSQIFDLMLTLVFNWMAFAKIYLKVKQHITCLGGDKSSTLSVGGITWG